MIFIEKKKKNRDGDKEDATIGCESEVPPRRSFRLSEEEGGGESFQQEERISRSSYGMQKTGKGRSSQEKKYSRTEKATVEKSFSEKEEKDFSKDNIAKKDLSKRDFAKKILLEKETPQEEKTPEDEAFRAALRILSAGANSSRMLREKLCRKGFSREDAAAAASRAAEAGLVGDCRLLIAHAEYLARKKFYGKSRIRMELLQKFDREIVERFFEEAVEEIEFAAYATTLAGRYADRGREYVIGRLRRAGYASAEIRGALNELGL